MADVIILGSMALDTIETPFGKAERILGGSASYASYAASFFAKPAIISVIGEDFPENQKKVFLDRGISLEGVQEKGKTFHWEGFYEFDMNEAKTIKTELNALASFSPIVPESYKGIEHVFLANIDPSAQLEVLKGLSNPGVIVMDTMNFWIEHKKKEVLEVMKRATIMLLNDGEARQMFQTTNLVNAAKQVLALGPEAVIIKKGEHGALLFTKGHHFNAPGYPLEGVKDPTGCGYSFGGALIGYLAKIKKHDQATLRKAMVYAGAIASFNAEDFSLQRLKTITGKDIEQRYQEFVSMRNF